MMGTGKSTSAAGTTWPMYFSKKDIGGKLAIRKGDLFPIQDKQTIKGLSVCLPPRIKSGHWSQPMNVRRSEWQRSRRTKILDSQFCGSINSHVFLD